MAENIAKKASFASSYLKTLDNDQRSNALVKIHDALLANKQRILDGNAIDMKNAIDSNLAASLIKRLDLSRGDTFDSMLQGILQVKDLEDPVGKCTLARKLDEQLNLYRVTAPIGVLLIIFESRPEVIANITSLAIKSGNAAILKGGKESYQTFKILSDIINETLASETSIPEGAIQLIESREEVGDLLQQDKYIDLVIPRGSNLLVRHIKANTKIPVLGHADGICSIYVDKDVNIEKAIKIIIESKTHYAAACNAVEQLLLHTDIVNDVESFGKIIRALFDVKVKLHVTSNIKSHIQEASNGLVFDASGESFDKEYGSFDLSVKEVSSCEEAIKHINLHSSKHTDCIITENKDTAEKFLKGVDSAGVYWNCSTRFADGFRYGFGTEVGISTNKIHARGPVGLEGLMSYQYRLIGDGHLVGDYIGGGGEKPYIHQDLDCNVTF